MLNAEDLLAMKQMIFKKDYLIDQQHIFSEISENYEKNFTILEKLFNEVFRDVSSIERHMISELLFLQEYGRALNDIEKLNQKYNYLGDKNNFL